MLINEKMSRGVSTNHDASIAISSALENSLVSPSQLRSRYRADMMEFKRSEGALLTTRRARTSHAIAFTKP